jgi:hypothetical protein
MYIFRYYGENARSFEDQIWNCPYCYNQTIKRRGLLDCFMAASVAEYKKADKSPPNAALAAASYDVNCSSDEKGDEVKSDYTIVADYAPRDNDSSDRDLPGSKDGVVFPTVMRPQHSDRSSSSSSSSNNSART